ncbi:hypothetical protein [Lichenicoccus sp.]|uniref:hypothetical protein n=1 Tax=Lichenicoccus sp. TaxID=2781899 RepID=UPI003D0D590D
MSLFYGPIGPTPAGADGARVRVSWSAIFCGVVLVVAIQIALAILGTGVGLGLINPGHADSASASSLGSGAGIWWLVSTILSLIAGSYVAARLAGVACRLDGAMHGMVVWGLALLLTVYLITTAVGGLLGGALSALGGTLSAATSVVGGAASALGDGVKAAAPQAAQAAGITPDTIQKQMSALINTPPPADPATMSASDATRAIGQEFPDLFAAPDKANVARQRITAIVAAQAHITPQEAQARVVNAEAQLNQTRQRAVDMATRAADASASAASHASFIAFVGLLIGALAATGGGLIASPRRDDLQAGS